MKRDSEIIRDLISLAFDTDPELSDITLIECLGLYERSLRRERELEDARVAALREEIKSGGRLTRSVSVEEASAYSDIGNEPPADGDAPCTQEGAEERPPEERGRWRTEKRAIYDRLKVYRDKKGLGCLEGLSAAINGKVSSDDMRSMLQGGTFEVSKWRLVSIVLDRVGAP